MMLSISARQAISIVRYMMAGRFSDTTPLYYLELAELVGSHPIAIGWALGHIQEACKQLGFPPLQCLAINMKTKVPGNSYNHKRHPYNSATVRSVREYKWDFDAVIGKIIENNQ
jgi:hypothetical protein